MYERIVVVLDPARDLEPSRQYALDLIARWSPSVVALYTAFEEAVPFKASHGEGIDPQMFVGKKTVKEFKKECLEKGCKDIEITKVVEEGPYEVAIPTVAAREGADLVVLGSFHGGVERRLVGSDTERVIEYSPCSVLLIRSSSKLPKEGQLMVFAHDSPRVTPKAVDDIAGLAKDMALTVKPVIGAPPKNLETARELGEVMDDSFVERGVATERNQVLTSRWILGPHGVVHRAVAGLHPALAVVARYQGGPWGNATHWLVHEFVADTPCPMLFLK